MLKRPSALLAPTRAGLAFQAAVLLIRLVSLSDALAQVQIVNCDAQVQSRKRGIAVNSMSAADFEAVAPGVSWYYNWGATPATLPNDVTMDFIPMAWNGSSSFQTSISNYLAAGNRPWRVFAINEPNLQGQAFMTPSNTAVTFKQVKALCDPYNIPVICPHMAEGSASNQSITAYDPIQMTNVTYTSPIPFLYAFLYYCGATTPAGVSTHSYGGYGDLTHWTGVFHNDWPTQTVWATEFDGSGAASDAQALATLIPEVDYCERTPWIEGYSWFMSRISGNPYNSLLSSTSGVLTAAGQAYVQMPVHQTNLFYRIPGQLQAMRYVTMNQMSIAPTTDVDGIANMQSTAAGGSLDYNIQVDAAGNYPLNFRVSGAIGTIQIYENGTLLGTANATQTGWATVSANVALPAGTQTLHVVLGANGQLLNWIDFLATSGAPSVPNNLAATAGKGQVALTWSAVTNATSYNVKRATTSGAETFIASTASTNYTDTNVLNGTTYYYVVSAVNAGVEGPNSVEVTATPPIPQASGAAVLVDFDSGNTNDLTPSPDTNGLYWNSFVVYQTGGGSVLLSNSIVSGKAPIALVDTRNGSPGWTLAITNLSGWNGQAAGSSSDFSGPYPATVTDLYPGAAANFPNTAVCDGMRISASGTGNPRGVSVTFAGLSTNFTYNLLTYGGLHGSGYGWQTNTLTVGTLMGINPGPATVIFNCSNNIATVVEWTNVMPSAAGKIVFTAIALFATNSVSTNVQSGALNLLELAEASAQIPPMAPITNRLNGHMLNLTWPSGQGWRLVSQTNRLSAGLNPNPAAWGTVPGYTDGNYGVTLNPTNPAMFYRLVNP
jgi:hypothetical protein